jgi:DNA polymerase elongation subunit (family B)
MPGPQRCLPFDSRYLNCKLTKYQTKVYKKYGQMGSAVNQTARALDLHPGSVSQAVVSIQKKGAEKYGTLVWDDEVKEIVPAPQKILLFDIEYAPTSAFIFNFYDQNIRQDQIINHGYMMSYAALWYGDTDDQIIYDEARTKGQEKKLVKSLFKLLEQADVCIGHNLRRYDMRVAKGRGLLHGLPPLKQPRMIDTLALCRREFKLPYNSLKYVAEFLGLSPKDDHSDYPGLSLWTECLSSSASPAWEVMKKYNEIDVLVLRDIWEKLRGHDSLSPNLGLFKEDSKSLCPKCGSPELLCIAPIATNAQIYSGYRCKNCGGVSRSKRTILEKNHRKNMLTNAR